MKLKHFETALSVPTFIYEAGVVNLPLSRKPTTAGVARNSNA